jgi:hypothetical protein
MLLTNAISYPMAQVTGQLHDLIRPKQYVELEYVTPYSTAHGIRIRMSIDDNGGAILKQMVQFMQPCRIQLLLPTRLVILCKESILLLTRNIIIDHQIYYSSYKRPSH